MQPIIRRTLTITITETWTITWLDGRETVWTETHEVVSPADSESGTPLLPLIDAEHDDSTLDLAAGAPPAGDEESVG